MSNMEFSSIQSFRTDSAFREAKAPVELHLFQTGGHGFLDDSFVSAVLLPR
jgi:hypothetical protein